MLEVVPRPVSTLGRILDVIGLDVSPYVWVVIGSDNKDRRGELTIDNMTRHGSAALASGTCRMNRSGITHRATGLFAREITMRFAGEPLTITGGKQRFTMSTASKRTVGTVSLNREGWSVRRLHGYLGFDETELNEGVQAFVFWLCIYQELSNAGGD